MKISFNRGSFSFFKVMWQGGGVREADDSVYEFIINMDSEFWTKPVGVFGFWCRDVCGTVTHMERFSLTGTQKHHPATSKIQNPYRRGIHRLNFLLLHRPHHFKK
jgi:hypothetical protein